jgi:OOP family OmpA-OmpF porin
MNLKQVIAAGTVASMLGLGPMIASAEEGAYFGAFLGQGIIDVSRDDLNALMSNLTQDIGGTPPSGTSQLNDGDSVWGVQIGYRFNRFVAAEVGYVDLGKAHYEADLVSNFGLGNEAYGARGRFTTTGPTVAVLGILPIKDLFDIYARGGVYFADTRFRVKFEFANPDQVISEEQKAGTQELFGGLGFAWNINADYALRAEGTYFLDVGDDDRTGEASVAMLTIGFVFR